MVRLEWTTRVVFSLAAPFDARLDAVAPLGTAGKKTAPEGAVSVSSF
jgi:hypothetical protein